LILLLEYISYRINFISYPIYSHISQHSGHFYNFKHNVNSEWH